MFCATIREFPACTYFDYSIRASLRAQCGRTGRGFTERCIVKMENKGLLILPAVSPGTMVLQLLTRIREVKMSESVVKVGA